MEATASHLQRPAQAAFKRSPPKVLVSISPPHIERWRASVGCHNFGICWYHKRQQSVL